MLAAAVELASYPRLARPSATGDARSQTCGATISLDVHMDAGQVSNIGMLVKACAVGQAAAAIFARHAIGRSAAELDAAHLAILRWLEGTDVLPEWPDLSLIATARAFPARHGAMLLPWKAALATLSTAPASG
ncbi:iron-sulfur cluster assembly scaffold protein [Aurantiacibacter aquimixticola]|uniref:Iron-sulfur cluster assembly scaffold protein n=2 Tax=Aurantiacibacter aquimixticola TaxID=1958945 RepID=A0A419RWK9_9SPHN|nr:iron-sulfur cluster assembly scaffold protein [Aurantiacibacter aquimixticola]